MIAIRKVGIIGLKRYDWEGPETEAQVAERHAKSQYYLSEIIPALRDRAKVGKPKIRFGAVDTITRFEEMCVWDATDTYMRSSQGHKWNRWTDDDVKKGVLDASGKPVVAGTYKPRTRWEVVTKMGNGYGYPWLWESIEKWLGLITPLFEHTILVGHLRLKLQEGKGAKIDTEISQKDIELSGKVRSIVLGKFSSTIGYLYRRNKGENVISFETSEDVACGSRAPHLADKHIVISQKLPDGTIETYWHNIFTSLAK